MQTKKGAASASASTAAVQAAAASAAIVAGGRQTERFKGGNTKSKADKQNSLAANPATGGGKKSRARPKNRHSELQDALTEELIDDDFDKHLTSNVGATAPRGGARRVLASESPEAISDAPTAGAASLSASAATGATRGGSTAGASEPVCIDSDDGDFEDDDIDGVHRCLSVVFIDLDCVRHASGETWACCWSSTAAHNCAYTTNKLLAEAVNLSRACAPRCTCSSVSLTVAVQLTS